MSNRLHGKTALITGAASGIGKATALLFADEGAQLILSDISSAGLQNVADLIKRNGGEAVYKKADVSKEDQVVDLIKYSLEKYDKIDILYNNAGILGDMLSLEDQKKEDWEKIFNVNVMGVVFPTKHIVKHMKKRLYGVIINTASVAGIRSGAGPNAYSASKAAVINFTLTAACDLGGYNVRVNAVCPGLIETGMTEKVFKQARINGKESKLGYRCELRRYGHPAEVAKAVLFLASDDASYITGQILPVDGGNTASLNLPGMKF